MDELKPWQSELMDEAIVQHAGLVLFRQVHGLFKDFHPEGYKERQCINDARIVLMEAIAAWNRRAPEGGKG